MSEPSMTEIRGMYSEALRRIAEQQAQIEALRAQLAQLRAWMSEYPNDKYTGAWWLSELDRILAAPPAETPSTAKGVTLGGGGGRPSTPRTRR